MKIYKYPVSKVPGNYAIEAPIVELLGVYLDPSGEPCLYAVVDPEHNTDEAVIIHVIWTGQESPALVTYWRYLNTLQIGALVYHYFASKGHI